jgi:hypothetical protein
VGSIELWKRLMEKLEIVFEVIDEFSFLQVLNKLIAESSFKQ